MIGKTKAIKNELKALLEGIKYTGNGSEDANLFTSVVDNFSGQFEDYPAARIIPNDTPSEIATTGENDRTVLMNVVAYIAYESSDRAESEAIDLAYDIQDVVSDAIDEHNWSSVTNNLVEAVGCRWLVAEGSTGQQLSLEFDIKVTYSKEI